MKNKVLTIKVMTLAVVGDVVYEVRVVRESTNNLYVISAHTMEILAKVLSPYKNGEVWVNPEDHRIISMRWRFYEE